MSDEAPKKRRRSPYTESYNTILVEFTAKLIPGDQDPLRGERKGRPARSPSLPPEEPKPDDRPPPAE
jgi:hypothetical protein